MLNNKFLYIHGLTLCAPDARLVYKISIYEALFKNDLKKVELNVSKCEIENGSACY